MKATRMLVLLCGVFFLLISSLQISFAASPEPVSHGQEASYQQKAMDYGNGEQTRQAVGHAQENSTTSIWAVAIIGFFAIAVLIMLVLRGGEGLGFINRLKVGARITLIIATLLSLLIMVAGVSIFKMGKIGEELVTIAEEDIPLVSLISEVVIKQ